MEIQGKFPGGAGTDVPGTDIRSPDRWERGPIIEMACEYGGRGFNSTPASDCLFQA